MNSSTFESESLRSRIIDPLALSNLIEFSGRPK